MHSCTVHGTVKPVEAYTVVVWVCMHKYSICIDGIENLVYKVHAPRGLHSSGVGMYA